MELLNPTPTEYGYDLTISGSQIQGAAMDSVINEARGLIYFNQSFGGPCPSGMAIRDAQTRGSQWCGATQIEAMGEVNNLIHRLAPVLKRSPTSGPSAAGWTPCSKRRTAARTSSR